MSGHPVLKGYDTQDHLFLFQIQSEETTIMQLVVMNDDKHNDVLSLLLPWKPSKLL